MVPDVVWLILTLQRIDNSGAGAGVTGLITTLAAW